MKILISFLQKWYDKIGGIKYSVYHFIFLCIGFVLLDFVWRDFIFGTNWFIYVLCCLALSSTVTVTIDLVAWMFKKLDDFVDIEKWYDFPTIHKTIGNPPKNARESAIAEVNMLRNNPFELKYFALKFGAKLSFNVLLFIFSFAIIFSCVNRLSISPTAFMDIPPEASTWYCVFYSLDVITTLGGAAPTPNVENVWIWVTTGIEIVMLIIGSLVILTLVTASVYEVFNLKTTYYSAFLRSIQIQDDETSS